jgi:hypothetical protein
MADNYNGPEADDEEGAPNAHPASLVDSLISDKEESAGGAAHPSSPKGIAYRVLYGGLRNSATGGLGGSGGAE